MGMTERRIEERQDCPICETPCIVSGLPDFPGDEHAVTVCYRPLGWVRDEKLRVALRKIVRSCSLRDAKATARAALEGEVGSENTR